MVWPSGSQYCFQNKCGYYFWGIHSHDSIWHIALIETAFSKFPFISPTFSGATLTGYNYLYDLFLFIFTKIGISSLFLFFKVLPFVWFIAYIILLSTFAKKLKNSNLFIGIFLIFSLFASSFSYYFTLVKDKTIFGSYGYLSQLPMHIMMNIQFALSLLGILYILIKILDKKISLKDMFIFGMIISINLGLKFYGGVATFLLVGFYILFKFILKDLKKLILYEIIISVFFLIALLLFYNPFASLKSGSIFSFAPFSIVHPITEDPSLFYLRKITDARYFLLTKNLSLRLIVIEALNLTLFLFFYMGVRFFGILYFFYKCIRKKITILDMTIFSTIIVTTLLSVLLVQKAEWWNSIQFFYYGIFLSTIYISEFSYGIIKKAKYIGWLIVSILVILAIPATFSITEWSLYFPGNTYLPVGEYEALQVLKKEKNGIVYSPIFDSKKIKINSTPIPLYASGDTAYVSAFSGKQSYISDILQLRLTGIDYKDRINKVMNNDCSILNEIDYIYYNNDYKIDRKLFDCQKKLELLFGNRTATIYRVIK